MNITNMNALISALEAASPKKFSMACWQTYDKNDSVIVEDYAQTPQEFHTCGNSACIAGYAALLPEWEGGNDGLPTYPHPYLKTRTVEGEEALAAFLDIPLPLAAAISAPLRRVPFYATIDPKDLRSVGIHAPLVFGYDIDRTFEISIVVQAVAWGWTEGATEIELPKELQSRYGVYLNSVWEAMTPVEAVRLLKWVRDHPQAAEYGYDF